MNYKIIQNSSKRPMVSLHYIMQLQSLVIKIQVQGKQSTSNIFSGSTRYGRSIPHNKLSYRCCLQISTYPHLRLFLQKRIPKFFVIIHLYLFIRTKPMSSHFKNANIFPKCLALADICLVIYCRINNDHYLSRYKVA